jgi:hypothetical protein
MFFKFKMVTYILNHGILFSIKTLTIYLKFSKSFGVSIRSLVGRGYFGELVIIPHSKRVWVSPHDTFPISFKKFTLEYLSSSLYPLRGKASPHSVSLLATHPQE